MFVVCVCVCSQVDSAWASGDHAMAHYRSQSARKWNIVGLVVGVLVHVGWVVAIVAVTASS